MLRTNLFAKASNEAMVNIGLAVKYEYYNMTVELLTDKATTLIARINNPKKNDTEKMIEGYKSELEQVEKSIDEYANMAIEIEDVVAPILEVVDEKLLRILASAENSKLEKYAIEWDDDEAEALYDAMNNIHDIDVDNVQTANFKKTNDILEKIVRLNLTFEENEYHDKLAVRLNKTDLRMINEAWVRGYRNKYKKDKKNDTVEYKDTLATTLVSRHKKDGVYVYNWDRFNALIVKIAIAKIANH